MKDNFFLDKHKEWLKAGQIPDSGLCNNLLQTAVDKAYVRVFNLFKPTVIRIARTKKGGIVRDLLGERTAAGTSTRGHRLHTPAPNHSIVLS